MTRESAERFFKNLISVLGLCVQEDFELLPAATFAIVGIGLFSMFWVMGVVVYDLILDPHFTTASLNAVSISPDKWPG